MNKKLALYTGAAMLGLPLLAIIGIGCYFIATSEPLVFVGIAWGFTGLILFMYGESYERT